MQVSTNAAAAAMIAPAFRQAAKATTAAPAFTVARLSAKSLIAEHGKAKRARTLAGKRYDALCRKHPGLEENRPLVLIGERQNGEKVYGRWLDDFDRAFPPDLLKLHKNGKARRRKFLRDCKKAYPVHQKKRRAAGLTAADREHGDACGKANRIFREINNRVPASKAEAALIARFLLRELPQQVRGGSDIDAGSIFSSKGQSRTAEQYDERRAQQSYAVLFLADMLRAFAKA